MIDFDFEYMLPENVEDAVAAFRKGRQAYYYNGGTECISRARMNEINPDVLVDVKHLAACHVYEKQDNLVKIGAAVPLNKLIDEPLFPMLAKVVQSIATRTARNKITVGGNLCSQLPYKEALLPFLLTDSEMIVATAKGIDKRSIHELKNMKEGELLLQINTDASLMEYPFTHIKKTKQSGVNYPIVTIVTLKKGDEKSVAFSGLTSMPFRSKHMEEALVKHRLESETAIETVLNLLPEDILDDVQASKEYRLFVCTTALEQLLK